MAMDKNQEKPVEEGGDKKPERQVDASPKGDAVTQPGLERNGVYRIAHLSDIHFGTDFDVDLWRYLCTMLADRHRPTAVVVTGDIVNSPWMFTLALARRELQALANRLNCKIYYVPGNHDVALWGMGEDKPPEAR